MVTFRPEEENAVYIGQGAEFSGVINARDSVVVDGAFDGEINCAHLIVGPNGLVKGSVDAASADIAGDVNAELTIKHLLVVRAAGRIDGKWECGAIEVSRGAVLNGAARVTEGANALQQEAGQGARLATRLGSRESRQERHQDLPQAPRFELRRDARAEDPLLVETFEEETLDEKAALSPVAPISAARRAAKLNLRLPRRSIG